MISNSIHVHAFACTRDRTLARVNKLTSELDRAMTRASDLARARAHVTDFAHAGDLYDAYARTRARVRALRFAINFARAQALVLSIVAHL